MGPPPVVVDGVVYQGPVDGYVYALDASTGEPRWRYETGYSLTSLTRRWGQRGVRGVQGPLRLCPVC